MSNKNEQRKREHIDIILDKNVRFDKPGSGLDEYRFVHQALPEIDINDIDLSTTLFGKTISAPLLISAMTGGTDSTERINRNLAEAAQNTGIAMSVGSQRCAIDNKDVSYTYQVRDVAPDVPLFANLGAVQLNYGYGISECRRAVEMIDADCLVLHLNPLHEALQSNGNTNFSRLLAKIQRICLKLTVPVIVKEVGFGISDEIAKKLSDAGVTGIDIAGAGGTCWSKVEMHRSCSTRQSDIASNFASWGIPTVDSLLMTKRSAPQTILIASGGISTGIDVAKVIALGADMAGIAAPLLEAANSSAEQATELLQDIIEELRICMFCIGASNIETLKESPFLQKVK